MSLLVTGSIGIDTVKTPFGFSEKCIGGSAVHFSMAASFFTQVRFLGVVGDDCPFELSEVFEGRDRKLAGVTAESQGLCFMHVRYDQKYDLPVQAEAFPFADSKDKS